MVVWFDGGVRFGNEGDEKVWEEVFVEGDVIGECVIC